MVHGYWAGLPRPVQALGEADALAVARAGSAAQRGISEFCERCDRDVWWRAEGFVKVSTCPAQGVALRRSAQVSPTKLSR